MATWMIAVAVLGIFLKHTFPVAGEEKPNG